MSHLRLQFQRSAKSAARGVTLIELMIALMIGALLIAGAVVIYMQGQSTYRTSDTSARMQEVARYAFNMIEPDVRMAGYWGDTIAYTSITNAGAALGPAACGTGWAAAAAVPIEGTNDSYGLTCTGTTAVTWGDTLVVRRASAVEMPLTDHALQLQASRGKAEFFDNGTLPSGYSTTNSKTHDVIAHAYYVSQIASPGAGDLIQYALRRKTLIAGASAPAMDDDEVIRGVQDIQVQLGIDTNFDGSADKYVDPSLAPTGLVVSVRIWLLLVAEQSEAGLTDSRVYSYANVTRNSAGPPASSLMFTDSRRRMLFSKTIQLRNART